MKYEIKIGVTAVRVAIALLASSSVIAVQAQQVQNSSDTDSDNSVKRVIITGSNIKTIDAETASPVQIIKREDIARQGVTNISDLIGNLSASSTDGNQTNAITGSDSFASGGSAVALRNLGEQSTLILVNGRRIASYGFADFTQVFTNVDSIPIDAVERVEVLKSGASAIYGSDAVAGVINIITRQNYQGVEVSADTSRSLQSHTFDTNKASIVAGFGDYDTDGFNVMVSGDLFRRENVMWTNLLQYTNPALTQTSNVFGTDSSYSYPGNIIDGNQTQPVAGCAPDLIIGGLCKYNRYDRFQAVPESGRSNLFVSSTFNLGGGTQAFAEASWSKSQTDYVNANPYYGDGLAPVTWGNPSTGQAMTFNYLGLSGNSPINPTQNQNYIGQPFLHDDGVGFRYRFTDAPSYNNVDGTQYRVLGGLSGNFDQFDWESAAGIMGSNVTSNQQGVFSSSGFIQEIGNYNNYYTNTNPNVNLAYNASDVNFFNQPNGYHPGQANSAAVINTLFPVFSNTGKTEAEFIDSKISGPLFALPAGNVDFALGGELRHESMNIGVSNNLQTGDIVGYGISTADASRNIESLYTELNIPAMKNLEFSPALRLDKFPDISPHFSPKLSMLYSATDSLKFRATFEEGFRAPNLVESANSLKFAFDPGTTDPLRCAQATALANDLGNAANSASPTQASLDYARAQQVQQNECNNSVPDEVKNNPALKPETSRSFGFGLLFEPVKGYSTSIDYWHIDRSNTIGLQTPQQLLAEAAVGATPPGSTVKRLPLLQNADPSFSADDLALGGQNDFTQYGVNVGPIQDIQRSMQNISDQSTSGIDVALSTTTSMGEWGKLRGILDGTYNLTYYDTSISTNTENLIGQYGYSHFVANLTGIWDYKDFSNSLRYNYQGGYDLQLGQSDTTWNLTGCASNGFSASQCRVASARTTDYALFYKGIKNLTLGMNIINLFQQRAPADLRAFGVSGVIPTSLQDAEGRMLRLSLNYKFM